MQQTPLAFPPPVMPFDAPPALPPLSTVGAVPPARGSEPRRAEPKARPAQSPIRLLPRRIGRYTLFDHIGRGGMADIYLAEVETDLGGRRLVVIKEVLPSIADSAEFAEMLITEAKLASMLSHANVVKVEYLGRDNGALYIAMEYVEGLDLREVLRRCAKRKIALPIEFSLRIVIEALKGLSYAHRARDEAGQRLGVVHRDVSPSNVLLSFEGEVKLCDFGIARANPFATELSEESIVGKAGYMSPEQARGEPLDPRADVFAAGIILWELLAGRRLYKAGEGERLLDVARRAERPPLEMRGLEGEEKLHAVIERALQVDREDRYPSAAAMLQDLEDYASSARMVASPLRFGDWLMEHFAGEVLPVRRARALAHKALARGPAAVIQPITEAHLPDHDMTPSAFPVIERADPTPSPAAKAEAFDRELSETPRRSRARAKKATPIPPVAAIVAMPVAPLQKREGGARWFILAMLLSMLAFGTLWLLATR
ncbi:MAG: protein kinase [Byssovorax sp.]